jgi:hypothetical protein
MKRRQLLAGAVQLTAGVCLSAAFPSSAWAQGSSATPPCLPNSSPYKGTRDGKVLRYVAETGTWETCADFGARYRLMQVYQEGEWLCARLQFKGNQFVLKSPDGQRWYALGECHE